MSFLAENRSAQRSTRKVGDHGDDPVSRERHSKLEVGQSEHFEKRRPEYPRDHKWQEEDGLTCYDERRQLNPPWWR